MALKRTAQPVLLRATVSKDWTSTLAATVTLVSLTVPGAQTGMFYAVECKTLPANNALGQAFCDTAGTVKVEMINPTAGTINSGGAQVFEVVGW